MNKEKLSKKIALVSLAMASLMVLGGTFKSAYNNLIVNNLLQNTCAVKRLNEIDREFSRLNPREVVAIVNNPTELRRYQKLGEEEFYWKSSEDYKEAIKTAEELRISGNNYFDLGMLCGGFIGIGGAVAANLIRKYQKKKHGDKK